MIKYFFISNIICNFTLSNNLKLNNMKKIQLIITTVILMLSTLTIKTQTLVTLTPGFNSFYINTIATFGTIQNNDSIQFVPNTFGVTITDTINLIQTYDTVIVTFKIRVSDVTMADKIKLAFLPNDTTSYNINTSVFTITKKLINTNTNKISLYSYNISQTNYYSFRATYFDLKVICKSNGTTAGISNLEHSVTQLTSFPNPSNGEFKIKFHTNKVKTDVFMYDISGRLVYENLNDKEIGENTLHMNTDFASGIYIIKVENKSFLTTIIK
jgi:hypothetical protein